jgi:hypothetical protein
MPSEPNAPWGPFLRDLDALLSHEVHLHCCGGFIVTMVHALARTTADLDVLSIVPRDDRRNLAAIAGRGSDLHKKHRVFLDLVTIATHPDDYTSRLVEIFPNVFRRIRLFALDPYDLVLTKLMRNSDRDRADVQHLATAVPLDVVVLRDRYRAEMRDYISTPDREDLTLDLWIEIIREIQEEPTASR